MIQGHLLAQMPGTLDPAFGNQGKLIVPAGTANAFSRDVILQADGKILVTAIAHNGNDNDFAVLRLDTHGQPDPDFGDAGVTLTDIAGLTEIADGIALDSMQRILVAGSTDSGNGFQFAVARYDRHGRPDSTFGEHGLAVFPAGVTAFCKAVAVQADQKILLGGYSIDPAVQRNVFTMMRLNPDGHLDQDFGQDGIVLTDMGIGSAVANALLIQPDGKILLAGQAFREEIFLWEICVARYLPDGTPDDAWDQDGVVFTPVANVNPVINTIALQPDQKIVAGGYSGTAPSNNLFTLARYETDGRPDQDFGVNGLVLDTYGAQDNQITDLVIQPDGHILIGGTSLSGNADRFALARLDTQGQFDPSFGNNGVVIAAFGSNDGVEALALQADGKLIVAGERFSAPRFDLVIARYETGLLTSAEEGLPMPSDVLLYPNPASDLLYLHAAEPGVIELFDHQGKRWLHQSVENHEEELDLQCLPAGAYFLRWSQAGNRAKVIPVIKAE